MNPDDFKKFNIGSIVRATQSSAALKHQLGFLIKVLEELDIQFSDCEQDPPVSYTHLTLPTKRIV